MKIIRGKKNINIDYERRIPNYLNDQIGVGFNYCNVFFQFYPDQVIQWAENGDLRIVAKFNIKKLHNVRN
jgi:hypothetical protein